MGEGIFPGEKAKEYLPPRESSGDIVGIFGAWLTKDGAGYIAGIACVIPAIVGFVQLVIWVIRNFQDSFIAGIFSIVGAWIACIIGYYAFFIAFFFVYLLAWLLGWVCYSTWTLIIVGAIVAFIRYRFF